VHLHPHLGPWIHQILQAGAAAGVVVDDDAGAGVR
jgi:hypothetical protein